MALRTKKVAPKDLPKELRVLSFKIRNVMGIEERALEPDGRSVIVSGPNASGKTSLLLALQTALGGGSLARIARIHDPVELAGKKLRGDPEPEPEVVVVLGGDGEYHVDKHGDKTAKVIKRVGDSQAFASITAPPQEFLSSLFDPQGANPVTWLLAKERDQEAMLLEALPLDLDEAALDQELADVAEHVPQVPQGLHALQHVKMVRDALFTARTGVNKDARGKKETVEQLRRELPANPPEDSQGEINEAEAEAQAAAGEYAVARERAVTEEREALHAAQATAAEAKEAARAEYEARLREIGSALGEAVDVAGRRRKEAEPALEELRRAVEGTKQRLAVVRSEAEAATHFAAIEEQAAKFERQAEAHQAEADRLTAALDRVDAFRSRLAKELPIPGLSIEDGGIKVYGVPLAQVNTAQRVIVAARVATARAQRNPLKVIFLDGLQELDSAHREALVGFLSKQGIQTFGAVVADEAGVRYVGAVTE